MELSFESSLLSYLANTFIFTFSVSHENTLIISWRWAYNLLLPHLHWAPLCVSTATDCQLVINVWHLQTKYAITYLLVHVSLRMTHEQNKGRTREQIYQQCSQLPWTLQGPFNTSFLTIHHNNTQQWTVTHTTPPLTLCAASEQSLNASVIDYIATVRGQRCTKAYGCINIPD